MKTMFSISVLFFLGALYLQFRHNFETDSSREKRLRTIENMMDFGTPVPVAGQSLEKYYARTSNDRSAKANGEKTASELALENEIAGEKQSERPVCFLLYGAGILFLFGGFMKRKH